MFVLAFVLTQGRRVRRTLVLFHAACWNSWSMQHFGERKTVGEKVRKMFPLRRSSTWINTYFSPCYVCIQYLKTFDSFLSHFLFLWFNQSGVLLRSLKNGPVFEVGLVCFKYWKRVTLIRTESILKPRRKDILHWVPSWWDDSRDISKSTFSALFHTCFLLSLSCFCACLEL